MPITPRPRPSDYVVDEAHVFTGVGELMEKALAAEILDSSADVVQAARDVEAAAARVEEMEDNVQD